MTRLLSGSALWQSLTAKIRKSRHTRAAMAYVGRGAYKLMPLKRGNALVVDLSLPSVRAGVTDPFEIEVFLSHGVQVYSRPFLHAKLIVTDTEVVAGSANASFRSASVLAEAALVVKNSSARRAAAAFIDSMCTQLVGPEYLALCKQSYRPPRFAAEAATEETRPKAWIVRLMAEYNVPEAELPRYTRSEKTVARLIKDRSRFSHGSFHWPSLPKMGRILRPGDWIVTIQIAKDGSATVGSPVRFLTLTKYARGAGKYRYIFHYEAPRGESEVTWARFLRAVSAPLRARLDKPKTISISSPEDVDALIGLWTASGRFKA